MIEIDETKRLRNNKKQTDLNERRRDAGLVNKSVWVLPQDAPKIDKMHEKGKQLLKP